MISFLNRVVRLLDPPSPSTSGEQKPPNLLQSQTSDIQRRPSPNEIENHSTNEIATFAGAPRLQATPNIAHRQSFPFLSLPGEIRNMIYRYALVSPKTYTVKLQFPPSDTALLRVNRQIFREASSIFYHENYFRIPETLFLGGSLLERLDRVYRLPQWKLQKMRNFVIDIPVCLQLDLSRLSTTSMVFSFILYSSCLSRLSSLR